MRAKNRNKSRIRSRVEHVFGVVKRLWGFGKVRYRGLAKRLEIRPNSSSEALVWGTFESKHLVINPNSAFDGACSA